MSKWYNVGNDVSAAKDSKEAIVMAKLDWKVLQEPVYIRKDQLVPEYFANIRSTDDFALGMVTGKYQIVQNEDAFLFTDNLIGSGIDYQMAGSVYNGKKVYLTAKLPNRTILGDKVLETMLVFTTAHDGKGSIRVSIIPMMTGHKNPINLDIAQKRSWSTIHSGSVNRRMEQAQDTLISTENYLAALVKETNRLAGTKVTANQVEAFLEQLLPIKTNDGSRKIDNVMEQRKELQNLINKNEDFKGTQWELINATSMLVAYMEPKRSSETFDENRFDVITCGHNLLDQAYKILLQKERAKETA